METVVKKSGNSAAIFLPTNLIKPRNITAGALVEIQEREADLVIIVRGNARKKPTLAELIAKCDLSAPMPDVLVEVENAPSVGQEFV
ncbi:hypothetical protein LG198_10770 [Methylobacillus arboreus]|uniref:AbrB/MazE/SpoVT family DNA-binding domain-containing protein n=1 Tax=Methylobacillus arboreus TaxID=755170 RepID=UPI001E51E4C0|nr:hypothetical protein [Methylobacillus arboreus]MCB5191210.1 hypothetical protein [Methylobacillus arboreus]